MTHENDPHEDDQASDSQNGNREEPPSGPQRKANSAATHDQGRETQDRKKPLIVIRVWKALFTRWRWRWRNRIQPDPNWAEIIGVFVALCIFAVGCIQAFIYWQQKEVMQKSLGQNQQTILLGIRQFGVANRNAKTATDTLADYQKRFRMEQRPFLSIKPFGAAGSTGQGQNAAMAINPQTGTAMLIVCVDIANAGRSPAVSIHSSKTEYVIGKVTDAERRAKSFKPTYRMEGPGDILGMSTEIALTPVCPKRELTKEEVQGFQNGTLEIFIVGGVVYRDMFIPTIPYYETTYLYRLQNSGMPYAVINFGDNDFGNRMK